MYNASKNIHRMHFIHKKYPYVLQESQIIHNPKN